MPNFVYVQRELALRFLLQNSWGKNIGRIFLARKNLVLPTTASNWWPDPDLHKLQPNPASHKTYDMILWKEDLHKFVGDIIHTDELGARFSTGFFKEEHKTNHGI